MRNIVNALLLRQGTVLLARRNPHRKAYPGLWSFPGGHVEAGETLEQALIRETSEEVNVAPVTYSAVAQIADPNATSEPITYHMYAVREWNGRPSIIDDEHTELRWLPGGSEGAPGPCPGRISPAIRLTALSRYLSSHDVRSHTQPC